MSKDNELTLMNEFNTAIRDSVVNPEGLIDIGDYKFYYPKEYGDKIEDYLVNIKKIDSKEVGKGSLCSASSSARLCTNYFYDDEDVELERPIHNDVSSTPTKMDAVKGNIFYECKCQEIVNGEHELLRKSYFTKESSILFKEFDIKNIEIKKHYNDKGVNDFDYCDFSLRDMGIDYPGKYYKINFNVKQLICHLIAIAHDYSDDEMKLLKYIVFTPREDIINASTNLTNLYNELDKQFEAIKRSPNIISFLDKHKIVLEKIKRVPVDKVKEHFID